MDNKTNSKKLREKKKPGTVTIVGGGEEWVSYIGDLPIREDGNPLITELDNLRLYIGKLEKKLNKLDAHVKTLNEVLTALLEKNKREKESDGI
jgi:hypothetical protein